MPPDPVDLRLIERANAGDREALAELYRRHRDFALRVAVRLTADPELAADAVQEAFVWWIGQFPGFALRSAVTTYLYTIVRSRCIDLARRRGRLLRAVERDDELARHAMAETLATTPDSTRPDPERLGAVIAALDAIPFAQQEVLLLHYGHGMTLERVAEALEIPLGTAKGRLRLGVKALRERLNPGAG